MNYKHFFFSLVLSLSLTACSQNKTAVEIDAATLLKNIKTLSSDAFEGRGFSTPGNYKAQQFIAEQFQSVGLSPYLNSGFIQQFNHTLSGRMRQRLFPIQDPKKDFSNVPDTTVVGGNVIGYIKGSSSKVIVITGHLDHLGIRNGQIYNGADDDASGTAALISIAQYFKDKTPKHTLLFAAVDAEEIGSHGAEYFVANYPSPKENIVLNINMDMIAHNDTKELYASGLYHYPQLKNGFQGLQTPLQLLFGHDDPNNKKQDDWTRSSDHRIFHKRQIPFIYFGVEDHKDYHKPTDTFENINEAFYVDAVTLIIQVIENFDKSL